MPLQDVILPFSRQEECSSCNADQHVCRLCKEYDADVANACREDRAEFISDKEKSNFCDFFTPRSNAYQKKDCYETEHARSGLADLFGESVQPDSKTSSESSSQSEADKALDELKRLFDD